MKCGVAMLCIGTWLTTGPLAGAGDPEGVARQAEEAGRLTEAFQLYVQAYQALPDPPAGDADIRIRRHLLQLALRLDPPPTLPDEAHRFAVRAQVMIAHASDERGFGEAEREMMKAVRAAPWDASIAFNLALVQEKATHYDAALANIQLYLSSNPPDSIDAKTVLYRIEMEAEEARQPKRVVADPTTMPGKVFVYRTDSNLGEPMISCDGGGLAKVGRGQYFVAEIEPGLHTIEMTYAEPIQLAVKGGGQYYLRTNNGSFGSSIRVMSEMEFTKDLRRLKPIKVGKVLDGQRVTTPR